MKCEDKSERKRQWTSLLFTVIFHFSVKQHDNTCFIIKQDKRITSEVFFRCHFSVKARDRNMDVSLERPSFVCVELESGGSSLA